MDSHLNKCGQSLVEVTLGAAILLLLLTAILGVISTLKGELKHDFLETGTEDGASAHSLISQGTRPGSNSLIEMHGSIDQNLDQLEQQGWQVLKSYKKQKIFLLERGDEKMVLTRLLGVKK